MNPDMEDRLFRWVSRTYLPGDSIEIERLQNVALFYAADDKFKASRGWIIKFIERYHLKDQFQII